MPIDNMMHCVDCMRLIKMVCHCIQVLLRNIVYRTPLKGVGEAPRRQSVECPTLPKPVGKRSDDGKFQLSTKETDFSFLIKPPTDKNRYSLSL